MSKTIAIFPARGGIKNTMDFLGRPVISYPIEAAKKSGLFDVIHVSTDSDKIASIAEHLGVDASFRRPEIFVGKSVNVFTVVSWTLSAFERRGQKFDDVCVIFPCSPFIGEADLQEAKALYQKYEGLYRLMVASEAPSRVEKYFRVEDDILTPIDESFRNVMTHDLDPAYYNVGMFTMHHAKEFSSDSTRYTNIVYRMPFWKTISIDSVENLRFAELLYKAIHG